MTKVKIIVLIYVLGMVININSVKASDDGFFPIIDEASFDECLQREATCRLSNNIKVSNAKGIDHDLILDLNGQTITPEPSLNIHAGLLYVERGAKLTINDSKKTGKISTGTSGNVWAAIHLIEKNDTNDYAELEVNGGTIEGYYYGIVGNGTKHNTKITINDGIIKCTNTEDCTGIYQPQKGDLIINNGNISGGTAIEIRSGNLTINKGTIKALASKFSKVANRSGTTTNGVGITIAQHTTKNAIKVAIYDGDISGQYALYEWNPHNNSKEDINKINLNISGGKFTSLEENGNAIYSQDFTNFISGGSFNTDVSAYLTKNADVASKTLEKNISAESKEKKKIGLVFPVLTFVLLLSITVGVIYYKNNKYTVMKKIG